MGKVPSPVCGTASSSAFASPAEVIVVCMTTRDGDGSAIASPGVDGGRGGLRASPPPHAPRPSVATVANAATVATVATEVSGAEMTTEAKVAAKVVAEIATAMPRKSPPIWR